MSRLASVVGVLRTLVQLTREDFDEMDNKLLRIASGVVGFAIAASIWYMFFRHIGPF